MKLGQSQRDQVVAARLSQIRERGDNISEYVKDLIYQDATSQGKQARLERLLAEIRDMMTSGAFVRADTGEPVTEANDIFAGLDNFGT